MALIIVTGLPCSGKTRLAEKIESFLKKKFQEEGKGDQQIKLISDTDNLEYDGRNNIYMSIPKEKELRGWLRSETQRYINLKQIVILDAAAYIKGFRYELFCLTKEAKGHYCIVEKLIDPEVCWKWNEQVKCSKQEEQQSDPELPDLCYNRETFDALVLRYEKCDENNRWDSPLFRLNNEEDKLDMNKMYNIITKEQTLMPNKCTLLTTTSSSIFKPTKSDKT